MITCVADSKIRMQEGGEKMHLYLWDPIKLVAMAKPFEGGQCQIHDTRSALVYRGEVKEIIVPPNRREICILFNWLYERGVGKNEFDMKEVTWKSVPQPLSGQMFQVFPYQTFYYQHHKHRLKLKAWGTSCRFYLPNDQDNIEKIDELQ